MSRQTDGFTIWNVDVPRRFYSAVEIGLAMSLKFGIYLVEQRIISPEQFCGLVKIQQETTMTLANIALRKNMLTIKQVASILDEMEAMPEKAFEQVAVEFDYLDKADATQLLHYQQTSCTPIRKLVAECGLLTERQAAVLYSHFERAPVPTHQPATTPATPTAPATPATPQPAQSQPRMPKFKSRPVIMRPYSNS